MNFSGEGDNQRRVDPPADVVLVLVVVSSLACAFGPEGPDDPANQEDDKTGLRGRVLRGPVFPGPQRVGESDEAPFSALFHVLSEDEDEVASFESDEDGRFELALSPGSYIVVPDESAPILMPATQRRDVEVPEEGYAEVTLRFDTGLR